MTTRSDLRRIAASLGVLGTELEMKGEDAWFTLEGWEQGPTKAPAVGERGGGGSELQAETRRDEFHEARRAARHFTAFRDDIAQIDALVQSINRRLDMACPPDMSELRNRRTGEFDPETASDMLAAGWCPNCFLAGAGSVPLSPLEGSSGVRRYGDRCRPCGDFRKAEGIDKPKEIVIAHAEGRRLSAKDVEQIVKKAKAAAAKKNKGKSKRRKAA